MPMLPLTTIHDLHGTEVAFLIGMLRERLGNRDAFESYHPDMSRMDQEKLTRLMIAHEVVHLARVQGPFGSMLSDDTQRVLVESLRLRSAWNLALFREMQVLCGLLKDLGVDVLVYKGLVLCKTLHGDLTTRPTRDLDILVRSSDFLRLREELLRKGFREDYHFPERYVRYYMGVNREAAFSKMLPDGVELNVEVQWAPVLPMYDVPFDNAPFFERAVPAAWGGNVVRIPSLEDQFLLLLAHHGVSELWHSLKHVTDLAFFLEGRGGELDWAGVNEGIRRWGMVGHAGMGFALCRELLGIDVPQGSSFSADDRLLKVMLDRLLGERLASRDQILPANMSLQLSLTQGLPAKSRLLWGYLRKWASPSLTDLEHLRLPRVLFPLYYVLKPFRFMYAPKG